MVVEFGTHLAVAGFDIKPERIARLRAGRDSTPEVDLDVLKQTRHIRFTTDLEVLRQCDAFIVTMVAIHNL